MAFEELKYLRSSLNGIERSCAIQFVSGLRSSGRLKYKTSKCGAHPKFWVTHAKVADAEWESFGTGEGFGIRRSQERGIFEALERVPIAVPLDISHSIGTTSKSLLNSNGLSFSWDILNGASRAFSELVERQVVLDAWLKKSEVRVIGGLVRWRLLNFVYSLAEASKVTVLEFPNSFGLRVSATIIEKESPPYLIFGYGSDRSIARSLERSLLEAWRLFYLYKTPSEGRNGFVENLNFYATRKMPLQDVFNVRSAGSSYGSNQLSIPKIKPTGVSVFDLSEIGLLGYVVAVENSTFHPFYAGALKEDLFLRKKDEVHPVA